MSLVALLVACGGGEPAHVEPAPAPVAAPAPTPAPPPAPPAPVVPTGARVFFVEPADGAKVKSPLTLKFGVEGLEVKPAGDTTPNSGHHHLIIGPLGVPAGTTVPKDETHLHFGQAQTEATIELKPGEYQLTMQFADAAHVSFGETLSTTIHVTVE